MAKAPSRGTLLALLLIVPLSLGCLGTTAPEEDPTTRQPAPAGQLGPLYLTGDMGLSPQAPTGETPEAVVTSDFYVTWTAGEEQPTWTGTPLDRAWQVTQARLTFHYTTDTAVVTTGPQDQGFPEFVVYVGHVADGLEVPVGSASLEGPDVVQAGEIVELTAELDLPLGGMVVPPGHHLLVKIAPVQAQQEEASQLQILTNATSTASRVELEASPLELARTTGQRVVDETGTLVGSAYALGEMEGASAASFEVEVPSSSLGLIARLERTTGAGIADIDLQILGPDGEVVAMSVTPEDDEAIALYAPNVETIGPGTWQVRAVNYGNVATQFGLQVDLLQAGG